MFNPSKSEINDFSFVHNNIHKINWSYVSCSLDLSDEFINEFKDFIDWPNLLEHNQLSETVILNNIDKVNWKVLSMFQVLSEDFLEKFEDKIVFNLYGNCTPISENSARKYKDKINWYNVSSNGILSEEFIDEFKNKVYWKYISIFQKMSEEFIEKYKFKLSWYDLFKNNQFSESFIKKFYKEDIGAVLSYQKLTPDLIKYFNFVDTDNNWLYKSKKFKLDYIRRFTYHTVVDDNIFAYKAVRKSGRSVIYPALYNYQIGKTYHSHCDCNVLNSCSVGLHACLLDDAVKFYSNGHIYKVKINIDDLGCCLYSNIIRAFKMEIVEKIDYN